MQKLKKNDDFWDKIIVNYQKKYMNKLIITANPSSKGFTHEIASKIEQLSKQNWDKVEIFNLYKTDLKQDFLFFEDKKDFWKDEITKKIQEKISLADEIIFVFPIWWSDMPAIMKNFFDCNFTAWFAFKYENGKSVWLLNWKTARVIATSWAPSFVYTFFPAKINKIWWIMRIWFCWMKQKSFTVFWNIYSSKTDKSKFLEKLNKLV